MKRFLLRAGVMFTLLLISLSTVAAEVWLFSLLQERFGFLGAASGIGLLILIASALYAACMSGAQERKVD